MMVEARSTAARRRAADARCAYSVASARCRGQRDEVIRHEDASYVTWRDEYVREAEWCAQGVLARTRPEKRA